MYTRLQTDLYTLGCEIVGQIIIVLEVSQKQTSLKMSAQVCLTTVIEMLYRDILIYAKSKGEMIMLTEY